MCCIVANSYTQNFAEQGARYTDKGFVLFPLLLKNLFFVVTFNSKILVSTYISNNI